MNKKLVVVCSFASVLLFLAAWQVFRLYHPEPIYGGKPEHYWVDMLANPTAFVQASQKAGIARTDCERILLRGLDRHGNPVSRLYLRWWPKFPVWLKARLPRPIDSAAVQKSAAILLPQNSDSQVVLRVLKNHPDPKVRIWIVDGFLSRVDNDATAVLIEALDDKDPQVCEEAVLVCSIARRDTALMIVVAKKALESTDPKIRRYGIGIPQQLLDTYRISEGSIKRSMSPDLVKALQDSDAGVRDLATNFLFRIAPIELAKAEGKSQETILSMTRGENLSTQTALHDFNQMSSNTPAFLRYGAGLMLSMANDLREKWRLDCPPLTTNNVRFDLNMTEKGVGGKLYSRPERFIWTFKTNTLCEMVDMDNSPYYVSNYFRARANHKTVIITNHLDRMTAIAIARNYIAALGVPVDKLPTLEPPPIIRRVQRDFAFSLRGTNGRATFYISDFAKQVAEYQGSGECALHQPLPTNYLQMLEVTPADE